MKELTIGLEHRSYPIYLCPQSSMKECFDYISAQFSGRRFGVVTTTTIASLYADDLEYLRSSCDCTVHTMPDGEQYKTLHTWREILDTFFEARLDRYSAIIAFGGGVVGDVAGFAAAAFMRGIDYIQIPTTLLAMVDSSVGGKTAVDHPLGKNLIGAFHQPRMVWIDLRYLDTLDQRQFLAGCGEVFKYGFIGGREMFEFIDTHHEEIIARNRNILHDAVQRSVSIKARVVEADERERNGKRAVLNFGHTFAHALERYYHFTGILHGEAVLWGSGCALELGRRRQTISDIDAMRLESLFQKLPHPSLPSRPDIDGIYDAMFSDKKAQSGTLRFILPSAVGSVRIVDNVPAQSVKEVLASIIGRV
jgi:3-dehydroquinate synthase